MSAVRMQRNIDVALSSMPDADDPADFLAGLGTALEETAAKDGIAPEARAAVIGSVLGGAFPAYQLARSGDWQGAQEFLAKLWMLNVSQGGTEADLPRYHWAVAQFAASENRQMAGRTKIRRLMATLGLGQDELGRMCGGVAGETIRRWALGKINIREIRLAQLDQHCARLDEMERIFLPERLVQATRRKASLFDGQTAIEWILNGRWTEVIQKYEAALAF